MPFSTFLFVVAKFASIYDSNMRKVTNRNVAENLSLPVRSRNGLGILKSWISWALMSCATLIYAVFIMNTWRTCKTHHV